MEKIKIKYKYRITDDGFKTFLTHEKFEDLQFININNTRIMNSGFL